MDTEKMNEVSLNKLVEFYRGFAAPPRKTTYSSIPSTRSCNSGPGCSLNLIITQYGRNAGQRAAAARLAGQRAARQGGRKARHATAGRAEAAR